MDTFALIESVRAIIAEDACRLVKAMNQIATTKAVPNLRLRPAFSNKNGFVVTSTEYTPEPNPKPGEVIEAVWTILVRHDSASFDAGIYWSDGSHIQTAVEDILIPRTDDNMVIAKIVELSDNAYKIFKQYFLDGFPDISSDFI